MENYEKEKNVFFSKQSLTLSIHLNLSVARIFFIESKRDFLSLSSFLSRPLLPTHLLSSASATENKVKRIFTVISLSVSIVDVKSKGLTLFLLTHKLKRGLNERD